MNKKSRAMKLKLSVQLTLSIFVFSNAMAQVNAGDRKMTVGELLQKAKEDSRGAKALQVQKSNAVLPESQISFESRKSFNLGEVKPPKLSDIYKYENADMANYEKTLNLQINELYKLTQKFKDSPNRGELWLRLAELYVEKSGLVDSRIQIEYDKKLNAYLTGQEKIKPTLNLAGAREYNRKALQLYEWFLKDFPSDPKTPQALFFLGYNYTELSEAQTGTQYFQKLVTSYPNNGYAGESHFAIAEYAFEKEKWSEAYKEYGFLIRNVRHPLHTLALYKASWCLYRLGKTEDGIKYLDYIIRNGKRERLAEGTGGKKINNARIENEAMKDLVIFFADTSGTQRAIDYFNNNAKKANEYIEKYAYFLSDKGNKDGATAVFKYLISSNSADKKAFEYQYQIVQNYFFSKNSDNFKSELQNWVINYNGQSKWYQNLAAEPEFLKKSNALREQTLRNYILQQHQTAQNSHAAYSQEAAEQGYKLYFKEFGNSKVARDMHFYFGELLYDMNKYGDATQEYRSVVKANISDAIHEKASQNILLAAEKQLPREDELQKMIGNSIQPIKIDPRIENFVKESDEFLTKHPNSEKKPEIKFRIGRLYYLTNNFDLAEKSFNEIIQQYPNTRYSEYSANLLLDMYNLRKDYSGLERVGKDLLKEQSISNAKIGNDIRAVLEKTSFKKAQNLESDKKYSEAATQYQLFALQNPISKLANIAYYNAAINFERVGRTKEAIANYNNILTASDPGAKSIKPNAKKFLAKVYQEAGLFEDAARLYLELSKESETNPLLPNFIYNAALMNEILGQSLKSNDLYKRYLLTNRNKVENADVLFKLAQNYRQAGIETEAVASYKNYVLASESTSEKRAEALYWIYLFATKANNRSDISFVLTKQLDSKSSGLEKQNLVNKFSAKLKVLQAQETFNKLKLLSIPANQKMQKEAIDKKLEFVNKLNEQLSAVVKLDSPEEIVTSLYILGSANEHMAQALSAVPMPASLTSEQQKKYQEGVAKIISPFSAKADESFRSAIDRGTNLQAYNEAYRLSYGKMAKKFPAEYVNLNEQIGIQSEFSWVGTK